MDRGAWWAMVYIGSQIVRQDWSNIACNKLYCSQFPFIYIINRGFANLKPTWKSYPFICSIANGEVLVIVCFIINQVYVFKYTYRYTCVCVKIHIGFSFFKWTDVMLLSQLNWFCLVIFSPSILWKPTYLLRVEDMENREL